MSDGLSALRAIALAAGVKRTGAFVGPAMRQDGYESWHRAPLLGRVRPAADGSAIPSGEFHATVTTGQAKFKEFPDHLV